MKDDGAPVVRASRVIGGALRVALAAAIVHQVRGQFLHRVPSRAQGWWRQTPSCKHTWNVPVALRARCSEGSHFLSRGFTTRGEVGEERPPAHARDGARPTANSSYRAKRRISERVLDPANSGGYTLNAQ